MDVQCALTLDPKLLYDQCVVDLVLWQCSLMICSLSLHPIETYSYGIRREEERGEIERKERRKIKKKRGEEEKKKLLVPSRLHLNLNVDLD